MRSVFASIPERSSHHQVLPDEQKPGMNPGPGGDEENMTTADELASLRQRLGRTGIWMPHLERLKIDGAVAAAAIERAGFGSAWVGGGNAEPDAFRRLLPLLEGTERLVVATGIANIWAREPGSMRAGADDLAERFPGRFILGLGVSHAPLVEALGRTYQRPLEAMEKYLGELDHPAGRGASPEGVLPPVVLAALGPKMLELARESADGAHPYFTTPEHTAFARDILGPQPLLVPEQAVVLGADRSEALAAGRAYTTGYLRMPNYVSNLGRLGFGPEDVAGGGSDRLVSAIVPHGPADVLERIREHLDAGADHVVVQPLGADGTFSAADLESLAAALAELPA
jgi:probable F420-dependent oxidoreductase